VSARAPPQGSPSNGASGAPHRIYPRLARSERRLTGIWYIVGFAFAGLSFVFLTFGAAWLLTHRNRGDAHKGLPYESVIDNYGDSLGRFGLSFYIFSLLFVAFVIDVIFIYLWAIVFRDLLIGGFVTMLVFVGILLLGLAYAWRKGVLSWK
jgi:NADH:ubiquinone oxidoreductase subunit 3 (subunit A)